MELQNERVYKPGSVEDDHLSRTCVAACLQRATRMHGRATVWHSYLRLLQMGFTKPRRYRHAGALLPHRFSFSPDKRGSLLFCGTDPSGRPAQPLAGILPFWSPDFPHISHASMDMRDHPTRSHDILRYIACKGKSQNRWILQYASAHLSEGQSVYLLASGALKAQGCAEEGGTRCADVVYNHHPSWDRCPIMCLELLLHVLCALLSR